MVFAIKPAEDHIRGDDDLVIENQRANEPDEIVLYVKNPETPKE
jgi:hypothetical protein